MVYVVDLDDTLVLTKNLNNDAYNFALEQNGQSRIKTNKRLTRENFDGTDSKKLIIDKQNYFAQKWLKYRVVVNEEILKILQNQEPKNCYLWTSADKNRADFILKELDLYKYFNKVIYDDKKDLNSSLKILKDITKSNVFLIFEDNDSLLRGKEVVSIKKQFINDFNVNKYKIICNNFDSIVKGHIGQYVVIKDYAVFGYFKTMIQAIQSMESKGYNLGEYIVQECVKNITDNMAIYQELVEQLGEKDPFFNQVG